MSRRRVVARRALPCGNWTRRVVRIPKDGGPSLLAPVFDAVRRQVTASEAGRDSADGKLLPCPCGAPAAWYRVVLFPHVGPHGRVVEVLTMDDLDDDLCDGCFAARCLDEERRAGWVRFEVEG